MKAVEIFRDMGTPDELRALAVEGLKPPVLPSSNLHVHLPPNFSAFENVRQVIDLAREQGVGVLGVSNYYYHNVYEEFAALAREADILPVFGVEVIVQIDDLKNRKQLINDPGNPGRMYLCGKGITRFDSLMTPHAAGLMNFIRDNDRQRISEMIGKLSRLFAGRGTDAGLDYGRILEMVTRRHGCPEDTVVLQERHVAQAFQELFFQKTAEPERVRKLGRIIGAKSRAAPGDRVAVQEEIRSHLMKAGKPAFVEELFLTFEQAHRLILELGGIPCYPTLADGALELCEYEADVNKLIEKLRSNGIYCAEFIPVRNSPEVLEYYVTKMHSAGFVVVAGTEHNTLNMLPIELRCRDGAPVDEEIRDIFWEGACVMAAHQFLAFHGECGFVDGEGVPHPGYDTAEMRMNAFKKLGAAVIQRYMQVGKKKKRTSRAEFAEGTEKRQF